MWSYASEFDWQKRFGAFWWSSPSCLCFWNRATSLHSQEWHTHGGELSGLFFVLHSLKGTDSCWWFMCTQSTKDVLERMVHSSDFHALCPPGAKPPLWAWSLPVLPDRPHRPHHPQYVRAELPASRWTSLAPCLAEARGIRCTPSTQLSVWLHLPLC